MEMLGLGNLVTAVLARCTAALIAASDATSAIDCHTLAAHHTFASRNSTFDLDRARSLRFRLIRAKRAAVLVAGRALESYIRAIVAVALLTRVASYADAAAAEHLL